MVRSHRAIYFSFGSAFGVITLLYVLIHKYEEYLDAIGSHMAQMGTQMTRIGPQKAKKRTQMIASNNPEQPQKIQICISGFN